MVMSADSLEQLRAEGEEDHARRAHVYAASLYRNPSFPARRCDYCRRWYRGPAVYCSLTCALADA